MQSDLSSAVLSNTLKLPNIEAAYVQGCLDPRVRWLVEFVSVFK